MKKPNGEDLAFKIFGAVGFILILVGVWYFYQYAVAHGWISHLARILVGVAFSVAIIALGELFNKRGYTRFSQLLMGGGIALLYFTVYVSYHFPTYREALGMTLPINSVLLFLVMLLGVWLALRANSFILTAFAFLLGYVAAYLTGGNHQMMISTTLLTAGLLYLNWRKKWDILPYPFVAASYFLLKYTFEIQQTQGAFDAIAGFVYMAVLFALFSATALLEKKSLLPHYVVPISVSAVSLISGLSMIEQISHELRGTFVFVLAAANMIVAALAFKRKSKDLVGISLLVSVALVAIGIIVQFDRQWTTLAWSLEAMVLLIAGIQYKYPRLRYSAYGLLAITIGRVTLWDLNFLAYPDRTVSWLGALLAFSVSAYWLRRKKLPKEEGSTLIIVPLIAVLLLTFGPSVELLDSMGILEGMGDSVRQFSLLLFWSVEGFLLLYAGLKRSSRFLRMTGYAVTILAVAYYLMEGTSISPRFAHTAGLVLSTSIIISSILLRKAVLSNGEEKFHVIAGIVGFGLLALTILFESTRPGFTVSMSVNARNAAVSVLWAVESLLVIMSGFRQHISPYKKFGILLFALTVGKILLFDLRTLETIYRILVTILVGVLALCISFVYVKHKEQLKKLMN